MRLQNKIALLTGAAAAIQGELMGFGGAAAHLFVLEGAKVVLTDIRDELGERAAAALRAEGHDAQDAGGIHRLVAGAADLHRDPGAADGLHEQCCWSGVQADP